MRHLALNVNQLDDSVDFYTRLLGMKVEWQPDEDNYYLTSGTDNLALHRAKDVIDTDAAQSLDHLGFIIDTREAVTQWFDFLSQEQVEMLTEVKDHRDGARSFYCKDPDGNVVQIIYHPPLSSGE
ncbi:MAG TPA: VOC family protein [Gammaproteobacteria bacterium]|nr:VOC family protein [Gammaproteobacteria bacterium]